jgi:hypothetical protein
MTSEPDRPDDDERDAGQPSPADAVDELEKAVVDQPPGDTPDPVEDDEPLTPAFELDLDPEDQGTAEAAAANPD